MKSLLMVIILLLSIVSFAQKKTDYLVVKYDTSGKQRFAYVFTNSKSDTITRLDTAKYFICFSDTITHFAIVGIKHQKGWWAIDKNENPLFRVYNTSIGEPTPDVLREGLIRIVDENDKIGFADYKGKIVIKPQFQIVSSFYKGRAIIGCDCKKELWCCEGEYADKHYTTTCKQTGYINTKGQILYMGKKTFEEMQKKIGWRQEY